MSQPPAIPDSFVRRPVRLKELTDLGFQRREIDRFFVAPARGVRAWSGLPLDNPFVRGLVVARSLPADAVLSGWLAAWLQKVDALDGEGEPIQVTVRRERQIRQRPGLIVWRYRLPEEDVTTAYTLRVTAPLRTCFDLMRHRELVEAVVAADAMLNANLFHPDELRDYIDARSRWKGVPRARQAFELADGDAQSPQETRLRLALVLAGLPKPDVNHAVLDERGLVVAWADLLYAAAKIVIEYDGEVHLPRKRRTKDGRRERRLEDLGYVVLRYTADDLAEPHRIVAEVRRHLRARGVAV
jgi:hypothetical protein